jgi:hypothetical protein
MLINHGVDMVEERLNLYRISSMKIGIIGAGEIGGTLTRRFTALGHHVSVANSRGPGSLAELAAETGAKPVSVGEAARSGEVVIVTIPERNIPKLPRDLFAATPETVIIVDTGNYYPQQRDGRFTEQTSMRRVSVEASPRRAKSENQNGVLLSASSRSAGYAIRPRSVLLLIGINRIWHRKTITRHRDGGAGYTTAKRALL